MPKRDLSEISDPATNEYEIRVKKLKENTPWMSYSDEDFYELSSTKFMNRVTTLTPAAGYVSGFKAKGIWFEDYGHPIPCACCGVLCRKPNPKHIITEMDCVWKDMFITKSDIDTNENSSINSITKTPLPEGVDWIDHDHMNYMIQKHKVANNVSCGVSNYTCSFLKKYQKESTHLPQRVLNRYNAAFTGSGTVIDFADIACSFYEEHQMRYYGSLAIPIDAYHDASCLAIVILRENNCQESYKWFDKRFGEKVLYDHAYFNDSPSIFYKWLALFKDKDYPDELVEPTYCCCYGYMGGKENQDVYKSLKYGKTSRFPDSSKIMWDYSERTNGVQFARQQLKIMFSSIKKTPTYLGQEFIYEPIEHSMKSYPFFKDVMLSPSYMISNKEHDLPGEKRSYTASDELPLSAITQLNGFMGSNGSASLVHTTLINKVNGFWGTHKILCSECHESYGMTEATKFGVQTPNYNIYWEIFKWLQLPLLRALDRPSCQDIVIITQ